jgi:hypothetical protein
MKNFKEAFCQHFGCSAGDYCEEVYFRCVVKPHSPFTRVLWWMDSPVVAKSKEFIEHIAAAQTGDEMDEALEDYHFWLQTNGVDDSKYRISGKTVGNLFALVMHGKQS